MNEFEIADLVIHRVSILREGLIHIFKAAVNGGDDAQTIRTIKAIANTTLCHDAEMALKI